MKKTKNLMPFRLYPCNPRHCFKQISNYPANIYITQKLCSRYDMYKRQLK